MHRTAAQPAHTVITFSDDYAIAWSVQGECRSMLHMVPVSALRPRKALHRCRTGADLSWVAYSTAIVEQ